MSNGSIQVQLDWKSHHLPPESLQMSEAEKQAEGDKDEVQEEEAEKSWVWGQLGLHNEAILKTDLKKKIELSFLMETQATGRLKNASLLSFSYEEDRRIPTRSACPSQWTPAKSLRG